MRQGQWALSRPERTQQSQPRTERASIASAVNRARTAPSCRTHRTPAAASRSPSPLSSHRLRSARSPSVPCRSSCSPSGSARTNSSSLPRFSLLSLTDPHFSLFSSLLLFTKLNNFRFCISVSEVALRFPFEPEYLAEINHLV